MWILHGTFFRNLSNNDDGLNLDISFPAEAHIHVYVPPTLHSCCVLFSLHLTDGRLTAVVSPRKMGKSHNRIWVARFTKWVCCELNSTGGFQKDLFAKTFPFSFFELSTDCAPLDCNDIKRLKYQPETL